MSKFDRLRRWLWAEKITLTPEEAQALSWADRFHALREERRERDQLHWRMGGPGSGEYESWIRDWYRRHQALMTEFRDAVMADE